MKTETDRQIEKERETDRESERRCKEKKIVEKNGVSMKYRQILQL